MNLVKKKKVTKKEAEKLISDFKKGRKLPKGAEKIFKVAMFYLEKIAIEMGKKSIDKDVILKYFHERHNEVVEKNKTTDRCKITFGEVIKNQKDGALVKSNGKIKKYKSFVRNLKSGDAVVLHYDYIVDRYWKKIKILVFGNPLVKKDSLALRVADKLKKESPEIEFKEFDTAESLEKEGREITILDVVEGLEKVEVIRDLNKISRCNIFSLHDFDLSYELNLLQKTKLIEKFQIIGIPPQLKEKETLNQVKKILSDPSHF